MGFFDLNIPYETSHSSKTTRMKLVIKAMELGYTGIAYNHTIKGVMSDHDRCSIVPFSLSSLLKFAPSLASSVNLHRELLGIPLASPFRQYTRLTVCVDTPAKSQALNSGNSILKTYDLVAVRPLNQIAFDHACEKSDVDIIAIDFSEKMPFRLKQPMVKAAIERGVYFEITYSNLIVDVQVRRQMISNAKLLVDWTRGRNLIFSSAAPTVSELRGPYDVANLSSLLGLSIERSKAAISKNCRNLLINALRKKHFYKETIRVELMPVDGKSDPKEPLSLDWLKWDPISSGEGDLQLEDMAKSFSSAARVSSSVRAINFDSVIDSAPLHGGNMFAAFKTVDVPVATTGMSEKLGGQGLPHRDWNSVCNSSSKNQNSDHGRSKESHLLDNAAKTSSKTAAEEPKDLNFSNVFFPSLLTQKHDVQPQKCVPCDINALLNEGTVCQPSAVDVELSTGCVFDTKVKNLSKDFNFPAPLIEKSTNSQGLDAIPGVQNAMIDRYAADMDIRDHGDTPVTENVSAGELRESGEDITLVDHVSFPLFSADSEVKDVSSVINQEILKEVAMEEQKCGGANLETSNEVAVEEQESNLETSNEVVREEQEHGEVNPETQEEVTKEKQENEDLNVQTLNEVVVMVDQEDRDVDIDSVGWDNNLKVNENTSGGNFITPEDAELKTKKHEEADTESNHPAVPPALPGKSRAKPWTHSQPLIFPLKRMLNPTPFKRKSKKLKHRRMY